MIPESSGSGQRSHRLLPTSRLPDRDPVLPTGTCRLLLPLRAQLVPPRHPHSHCYLQTETGSERPHPSPRVTQAGFRSDLDLTPSCCWFGFPAHGDTS